MTPAQFQAIKKRNAARTPGKWETAIREGFIPSALIITDNDQLIAQAAFSNFSTEQDFKNMAFAAHASEDIPALIAEVERLQTTLKEAYNEGHSNAEEGRH